MFPSLFNLVKPSNYKMLRTRGEYNLYIVACQAFFSKFKKKSKIFIFSLTIILLCSILPLKKGNKRSVIMKYERKILHCLRCNWQWFPRKADPKVCPKCKSAWWDTHPAGTAISAMPAGFFEKFGIW